MSEYLLETHRPAVPIEDLNILVQEGIPIWITAEQKQSSLCLQRLEKLGTIRVTLNDRSRIEKSPRAPTTRPRPARPVLPRSPAPPASVSFTRDEVASLVAQAARQASQETAKLMLGQLRSLVVPAGVELEARVEAAVATALANHTTEENSTSPKTVRGRKKRQVKDIP